MNRRDFLLKGTYAAALAATTEPHLLLNALADNIKQLILTDKNVTPRILIAPDAFASEKFAAQELSIYLKKISEKEITVVTSASSIEAKAEMPLIILGHHPQNDDLHPEKMDVEESVIDVGKNRLRIVGGMLPPVKDAAGNETVRDRGTLYGVYNLLDQLGVRWYRPEPWGEYVPSLSTISLPYGKSTFKPVYQYRYGINSYRWWADQTQEQGELARLWATRNRQNVHMLTSSEYGGSYNMDFQHNYHQHLPPEKYFAEHPDYYALINGKRSDDPNAQLDLGNPEVQDRVAQEIIALAKSHPAQTVFSLEPNDGDLWGTEADSVALDDPNLISAASGKPSMSNRVAYFNNLIAKRLAYAVPGVSVGWLAYNTHTEVPTLVKSLEPNTIVQATAYAGAYSDYTKDLHDPNSVQNARFLKIVEGWGKLTTVMTYEYWSGYAWFGPMPVVHTMVDRLRAYRHLNVVGSCLEAHPSWGPQGLSLYMYTKLLWNPDLNVQEELDLYYKNYYGPAAAPMKEYHELMETSAQGGPYFCSGGDGLSNLFTVPLVAQLGRYMNEARTLVKGKNPYEQRLEGVWAGYEVVRMTSMFNFYKSQHKPLQAMDIMSKLKAFILSYKEGDVFDNGSHIFPRIFYFMSAPAKDLEEQVALLHAYQDVQISQNLDDNWRFSTDPQKNGLAKGAANPSFNDSSWSVVTATKPWQQQGYVDYKGTAWYRKIIEIPSLEKSKSLLLFFGAVDGDAIVYLNGEKIGEHILGQNGEGWDKSFLFDITDNIMQAGIATIAVQVTDFIGMSGIFKEVNLLTAVKTGA